MLRNTSSIRHAPLPALARLLTVGLLSAVGLWRGRLSRASGIVKRSKHSPHK